MANNKLHLNTDKTRMMIITNNPVTRKNTIVTNNEVVRHRSTVKILGLEITQDLNWNHFINDSKQSIIKQLRTR